MLIVFFIKPIAYQSPTEREEFIEKFRKSKERQINLELMRKEEKEEAKAALSSAQILQKEALQTPRVLLKVRMKIASRVITIMIHSRLISKVQIVS